MRTFLQSVRGKKLKPILIAAAALLLPLAFISPIFAGDSVNDIAEGETYNGDKIAAASKISNAGQILGDLIAFCGKLSSQGSVTGDIIACAEEANVSGKVGGNIRMAGGKLKFHGSVGRNITFFGGELVAEKDSVVDGSLYAFTGSAELNGRIEGNVSVYAGDIVIGGEILGNVDIATGRSDKSNGIRVVILPEANIHGTLTYASGIPVTIPDGAHIGNVVVVPPKQAKGSPTGNIMDLFSYLLRYFATAGIYFGLAIFFYTLFPNSFPKMADTLDHEGLLAFGVGLVAIFSPVALIVIIALLAFLLSFIIQPSLIISIFTGLLGFYVLLYYFASIPVCMWIGNRLMKEKAGIVGQFTVGLTVLSFFRISLHILKGTTSFGIFTFASTLLELVVLLFGSGVLLRMIERFYKKAMAAEIV